MLKKVIGLSLLFCYQHAFYINATLIFQVAENCFLKFGNIIHIGYEANWNQ
jgi:hypothetical protein